MKILFIHSYMHVNSGSGKVMFSEAELLEKNGHEVFFFTTNKPPYIFKKGYFKKYFPKYVNYRSNPKYLLRPFYNPESEKKLDVMLKEIKPDIVHAHEWGIQLTPSVLNACYKNKIPVVLTIHGPGFFCPGQTLLKGGREFCKEEPCIRGNYWPCLLYKCLKGNFLIGTASVLLKYIHKNIFGLVKNINHYICPSNAMTELAKRAGIEENRLTTVYNSVDKLPELQNEQKGDYFLYIGRLEHEKGLHYLIEVMKDLPKDIELHIAGKGSEEPRLKEMAKGLDNIKFLGYLTGESIEEEYRGCIASILPCNWFEAFGLTITESFSYAKPVIASNVGGIPEIIEHEINGILTEPGNKAQIAEAILKLRQTPELAANMGKQGRLKVEALFNPQEHYNKLIEVYKKVENTLR